MFNTLTREGFFSADNEEARSFNEQTKKRFDTIYEQQQDPNFLKANALPKICKGMEYTPPVVSKLIVEARHANAFVITNNAHSK